MPTLELEYAPAEGESCYQELVDHIGHKRAKSGAMLGNKSDVSVRNRYQLLRNEDTRTGKRFIVLGVIDFCDEPIIDEFENDFDVGNFDDDCYG
jgi:hypothetical protein